MEGYIAWDKVVRLWDHFDERMTNAGYRCVVTSGERGLTDKTTAIKTSDDLYAPIIKFYVFNIYKDNYSFSIEVIDRNGNGILEGKTIGYFRFSEYTEKKLDAAVNFILETFGCYGEDNTVPTKFIKIEKTF